jgi:multidrug efflux pump subunit AcrA (membrane-fusion protein)
MGSKKIRSAIAYAILTAAVLSLAGFAVAYVYMPNSASAASVRTASVTAGNVETSQTATGNIQSASTATVGFPISGTLTAVNVTLGSRVSAGQVIAKISPSSAQTALSAAEASLSAAEQNLTTAEQGGSTANKLSNQLTITNDESAITNDEEQLTTDEADLVTAKQQLSTDENLACPAAGSSTVTSAIGGASTGSASSITGGSSQGTNATANSGSTTTGGKFSASVLRENLFASKYSTVLSESLYLPDAVLQTTKSFITSGIITDSAPTSGPVSTTSSPVQITTTSTTTTTLAPVAPVAVTGSASSIATNEVNLSGSVTPGNTTTSYYFAWGATDKLGQVTPTETLVNTSGTSQVSAVITGLKADTNYLFQLIAQNSQGISKGSMQLFTTASSSCAEEKTVISEDKTAIAKQEATVQNAKETLSTAEASIAQSNQSNNVTVATDEATVAQDQANVTADQKDLQETTLVAPISGTITSLNGAVGETVAAYSGASSASSSSSATGGSTFATNSGKGASSSSSASGSGFATITNLNNFEIIAGFAEADISSIKVGQSASITFPALTNVTATGKVTYVSDIPTTSSSVVTYDVTIAVSNPPSSVKDGMTADISIVTGSVSNVLTVPSAAVTTNGSTSTVTVDENGSDKVINVKTGLVGSSTTQIISGLQAGETVVLPVVKASSGVTSTGGFGGRLARLGGGFGGGGAFGG